MRRINKKLVEALDKLIAKYSGEEMEYLHHNMNCPLCDLFYVNPLDKKRNRGNCCKSCPNMYFFIKVYKEQERIIGCDKRKNKYPQLNYLNNNNYPTLKQFWTDYKSLYLERKYSNSEIMEILIKPFKEEQK